MKNFRLLSAGTQLGLIIFAALPFTPTSFAVAEENEANSAPTTELSAFLDSHDINDVANSPLATQEISQSAAVKAISIIKSSRMTKVRRDTQKELDDRVISFGEYKMPIWFKKYGDAPPNGHCLFISMHGGGGAPKQVNDRQWENQKHLYEPTEGIYVAPRAPTDTWNLWHQSHIDALFDRLIEIMVAHHDVDPNRVYIMGYSAGGDGVYQLAPRMADRLAAAAMMAGHPNETKPDGLRNIGFTLFMGSKDSAYKRNKIAAEWKEKLASLKKDDPGGYEHNVTIYPEFGHWMQRKDADAVPWMAKFKRKQWPDRIVWLQDDVTHNRYYWLQLPANDVKARNRIVAKCEGQSIVVDGDIASGVTLLLHDDLVNLDQPIVVTLNGHELPPISAKRTIGAIAESVAKFGVARPIPTSSIQVSLP